MQYSDDELHPWTVPSLIKTMASHPWAICYRYQCWFISNFTFNSNCLKYIFVFVEENTYDGHFGLSMSLPKPESATCSWLFTVPSRSYTTCRGRMESGPMFDDILTLSISRLLLSQTTSFYYPPPPPPPPPPPHLKVDLAIHSSLESFLGWNFFRIWQIHFLIEIRIFHDVRIMVYRLVWFSWHHKIWDLAKFWIGSTLNLLYAHALWS